MSLSLFRSLFFTLSACTSIATAAVPLADFARHAQFNDIKISPDGDYAAASAIVDGKTVLSLIHLSDMKGVNLRPRENRELAQFWWVAPDRVMYTVGDRSGPLESPSSTGELYAINANGSDDGNIFGYRMGNQGPTKVAHGTSRLAYAELVDPLRDDPRHALIATYAINGSNMGRMRTQSASGVFPAVERIDLYTGATTPIATSPLRNAAFLTDHHGNVRFAYGQDVDQKMKVWYRSGANADWTLVLDEARDHKRMTPLEFNRKEDKVYFSCGGTHEVGGVCTWNAASGAFATLWSGTTAGIDSWVSSFDDDDIVAIRSMPGRIATTLLDKDAPEVKLLTGLMQQFPGEDVRITSSTPDGKKVIFLVSSGMNPGEFYLYDAVARKATLLFSRRPWIKPAQMAQVVPIDLKARDGLALHGYLTRPPGETDAKNLPLVVYVHGGPYGIRDTWEFDPYVQMLASRGYAVLQVNYRGSGGYGRSFVEKGFRQWGGAEPECPAPAS
ncbi:MAG: prolyl oligopeptidase family serine peptidase, partial [Dokdonella sp.]